MAYYDLAFIRAQIKNFISIQDVFNKYCYGTKQVQGRYKCPFNPKEDRYNFMIKGRSWRCFSCGCSGDEISLVQKLFDLNTKDAMIKIATDFRLALEVNDKDAERIKKEAERREEQRKKDKARAESLEKIQTKLYSYVIKQIRKLENIKEKSKPETLDQLEKCEEYMSAEYNLSKYNVFADILAEQPSDIADNYFCLAITKDELHNRAIKFIKLVYEGAIIL
jgi:DNA primase